MIDIMASLRHCSLSYKLPSRYLSVSSGSLLCPLTAGYECVYVHESHYNLSLCTTVPAYLSRSLLGPLIASARYMILET
jgi:hypothetical protein